MARVKRINDAAGDWVETITGCQLILELAPGADMHQESHQWTCTERIDRPSAQASGVETYRPSAATSLMKRDD